MPVGRDELLKRHSELLLHARHDPHYTWAVLGERGVGKTVFLTLLGDRMREHGWAVLDYSSLAEEDPVADLLALLPDALRRHWTGRGWQTLQRELSVEFNTGVVKVQGRVLSAREPSARSARIALEQMLERIGQRAAAQKVGLLITIDEAQTLGSNLKPLGSVMQMITERRRHPVAWALAGTRDLSERLLASGSFPERMRRTELQMLTAEQSLLALIQPANARGVTWDPQAAALVVEAAAGYPYFVQLGGYEAWQAEDQETVIGDDAATKAVAAIRADADRMFGDRWGRLGPVQRQYMAAAALLALHGNPSGVSTGEIARLLGRRHRDLSVARDALVENHRLLAASQQGYVRFTLPLFEAWLQRQLAAASNPEFAQLAASLETQARAPANAPRRLRPGAALNRPRPPKGAP